MKNSDSIQYICPDSGLSLHLDNKPTFQLHFRVIFHVNIQYL